MCKIDELVKKFIGAPSEKLLDRCTKEQLTEIAEHFEVVEGDKKSKDSLKANVKTILVKMGVLENEKPASMVEGTVSPLLPLGGGVQQYSLFELQRELLMLHMKLEQEKELTVEKLCQGVELGKVLAIEKMRYELKQAKLEL